MERLKHKIKELIEKLKSNNNPSYKYFESLLPKLDDNQNQTLEILMNTYAITQYANFNSDEEKCLDEVLELAKEFKNKT